MTKLWYHYHYAIKVEFRVYWNFSLLGEVRIQTENKFKKLTILLTRTSHWYAGNHHLLKIYILHRKSFSQTKGRHGKDFITFFYKQVVLLQPWLQISHFSNLYNKIARFILTRYSKGVEPITITLYSSMLSGCTGHSMMTFTHTI